MTRPTPARTPDYPSFPEVEACIGENPARFLSDETGLAPVPRIRGIDDEAVLDAWIEVAVELGPRKRHMAALNQQRQYLREAEPDERFQEFFDAGTPQTVATDGGEI